MSRSFKGTRWARQSPLIARGDARTPMQRLLEDCLRADSGTIEPDYEQQFRTMFKAVRMGYLDESHRLTDAGRAFLESCK